MNTQNINTQTILAWHWLKENKRLQHSPYTSVYEGQTLYAHGKLQLCNNGLHASERVIDALRYAPGFIACRVELKGEFIYGADKFCARERKCLWMIDANNILSGFLEWCIEQTLSKARKNLSLDERDNLLHRLDSNVRCLLEERIIRPGGSSIAAMLVHDTVMQYASLARVGGWDLLNKINRELEGRLFEQHDKTQKDIAILK